MNYAVAVAIIFGCIAVGCETEGDVQSDILVTLLTLKSKVEMLEEALEGKTKQLTEKLEIEQAKTNMLEKKLETEITKIKQLEENIDVLLENREFLNGKTKRLVTNNTTNIAFSSYLEHDVFNLGPGHTLQFGGVILNDGNAYNAFTGTFTFPISGVYLISATIQSPSSHRQWFNILADGQLISTMVIYPFRTDYHAMGSNTVLVRLNKGQSVWVAVDKRDSGEILQGGDDVRATTFSGLYLFD